MRRNQTGECVCGMARVLAGTAGGLAALVVAAGGAWALPINGQVNVRPITVRPAGPVANDPGILNDFNYANRIYSQIGLQINRTPFQTLVLADGNANGTWTDTEFLATANNMARGPAGDVHFYYVSNYQGAVAETFSEETNGGAQMFPGIISQAGRNNDTLAHELGHLLLDEWRWRPGSSVGGSGIHSSNANDLMASTGAVPNPRNVPGAINQTAPGGTFDQIGKDTGYLNGGAGAPTPSFFNPQIFAMYNQSSFVQNVNRDRFGIEFGTNQTPSGTEFQMDWGAPDILPTGLGMSVMSDHVARKTQMGREDYAFYFQGSAQFPAAANGTFDISIRDIDSLDTAIASFLSGGLMVTVFDDHLSTNAMVLTPNVDFTWAAITDHVQNDIDLLQLNINRSVLSGKRDIAVMFQLQVPGPGAFGLLAMAGVAAARRKRNGAHGAAM